ncbi:hypothetical protein D9V41_05120 [Aeromicrobium phragmitis]|uniref:Flagellar hook-associated protein 2 n=1 Tax=Aeromicrobium phragmitis TaxID=2478914 RepID=A0A3L8PMH5_9ACTN|nr:flagellar filament capping protein FliD [Aeromicrobium phragmitis]RLV56460.1 hypothetical protein D9V41_05120 [Aeromicrobium phragmitis]
MATGTASISGLSGFDSRAIVDQLMALEAVPQDRLKTKLATEENRVKVLQGLNTRLAALVTKAKEFGGADTWNSLAATSSHQGVSVATLSGGVPGHYTIDVESTATAHRITYDAALPTDQVVPAGSSLRLTVDGETRTIDAANGTLAAVVNALNGSGTGVRASTVKLDDGTLRLSVTSVATGAESAFTLTAEDGSPILGGGTAAAGRDAVIVVDGDRVTSSSNTFADVVSGLSFTIGAAAVGESVSVEVKADEAKPVAAAKEFVAAVNEVLAEIDRLTASTPGAPGPLAGDSQLRTVRNDLLEAVFPGSGSLADVGIQTTRNGTLTFDAEKFSAALGSDPAGTRSALGAGAAGFAGRIQETATAASESGTGLVSVAIAGRSSTVTRLQESIDAWDLRLEMRRNTLSRQFTALETSLATMQGQADWLAGQLSSLNASSSSR